MINIVLENLKKELARYEDTIAFYDYSKYDSGYIDGLKYAINELEEVNKPFA